MKLTDSQRQMVQENMGLVGKVIKDRVHGTGGYGLYSYDDLFQIGCIGLCKAAATDKGGCFSTYAYRLIWNEICNALISATRRGSAELATDPEFLPPSGQGGEDFPDSALCLEDLLSRAERKAGGTAAKGMQAMRLQARGYTCREIGRRMGARAQTVSMWISRARKFLKTQPELLQEIR